MVGFKAIAVSIVFVSLPAACPARAQECVGDANGDSEVTVNELVTAVNNALQGCALASGRVPISGSVVGTTGGVFRVWAVDESGAAYATETDPVTGRFRLSVPPGDWYVMGFGHYQNPGEMHFAGHMVFPCRDIEDDHFFVSGSSSGIELGSILLGDDATFAMPEHGPLQQLDHDGDGTPDSDDPDIDCEDIGDRDGDGFHDDDMNHDGYHDDDLDHNGHADMSHHGGHGPGHMGR